VTTETTGSSKTTRGIKQRDYPMRGFGSSRLRCPLPPECHLALLCLSRRHIRVSFRLS